MEPYDDNGVVYQLVKSSASRTGYLHVVEPRAGQFHAKLKLPGETRQSLRGMQDRAGGCTPCGQVQG